MTLSEYQEKAYSTAIYKDKIIYPVLGLANEFLSEYISKIINHKPEEEIVDELMDAMWYVSAIATDLGFKLEYLFFSEDNINMFTEEEQFKAFCFSLGTICGKVKKWMRDYDKKEMPKDYLKVIKSSLIFIIQYLSTELKKYKYTLEDALQMNIDKLQSRKERGVIKGDGDNR